MKRIALFVVLVVLAAACIPAEPWPTPQVVVITSPPVEVTREVEVTRVVPVVPDYIQATMTSSAMATLGVATPEPNCAVYPADCAPTPLPSYMATQPVVQFTDITWTRDVAVPRICTNQGVAFKMVLEGKPGLDVVYHINHYDSAGDKVYRSNDFAGTIESDGKLVKTFQESFPYQSKWRAQLVITWPLPLITRNASITVDCN